MTPRRARQIRYQAARTSYVERLAQIVLAVVLVGIVYAVGAWVAPVLAPVALSLLLAYFLDPVIDWFEARRIRRTIAIVLVATVVLGALAAVGAIVVPVVAVEIGKALSELPEWIAAQYEWMRNFATEKLNLDLEAQLTGESALQAVSERVQGAIGGLANAAADSVASLLNIILIPIFTFYFLRDFDTLKMRPLEFVPPRYRDRVLETGREMDDIVGAWLRGQVQVAVVLSVFYAIALGLVGLELGVFIGILAGLLNVVPYLGLAIGVGLSALMALIYGEPTQLIGVAVVFVVAQLLDDYVLKPRLVGEKVGMGPMMVMAVLLLGGSLFGFFGLLLSIPAVAASTVIVRRFVDTYRESDFFTREDDVRTDGSEPNIGDDMSAEEVIAALGLEEHPEGGFFREVWRSDTDGDERAGLTSIYFLLTDERDSHWHRVDAAETWSYHAGSPLELSIVDDDGRRDVVIGVDLPSGERPQETVPAGAWQAARTLGAWTLVGCAVGPGFEFDGFELAPEGWSPET